ncbi:MAG: ATP-binding protein [Spirulina sp. SIO3F2]|nr:ATP-binding protein [Spirulina sp. SIO3F2]
MSISQLSAVKITPFVQVHQAIKGLSQALQNVLAGQPPNFTTDPLFPPTFRTLAQQFGLTAFEQFILLLAVGIELNPQLGQRYGEIMGNAQHSLPTFALALTLFPQTDWQAFTTQSPLLHWRLIELAPHPTLTQAPLRIQPRILAFLLGTTDHDPELSHWVQPFSAQSSPPPLATFYQPVVQGALQTWASERSQPWPLLQLCGLDLRVKTTIAQVLCQQLGCQLWRLSATLLPSNPLELGQWQQCWQREALLSSSILLIEGDRFTSSVQQAALTQFLETLHTPVILCSREPQHFEHRRSQIFEVQPLPHSEKHQLWQQYLGERAVQLNGSLAPLIAQFNLNSSQIQVACESLNPDAPDPAAQLWDFCRQQARPRLEHHAQRLDCVATWADLVLPPREKQVLEAVAIQVRQRAKVYQEWGFAQKSARGLGLTVLFAGASGTGKTMAAEVLANALRLDLYRIDLSSVVSKYIGETEKNLAQIFDAAETGGVVLLFDEADALFGKRTEVKDSHDRHANIEVSYLLQRMEAFRGLAILTTNLKDAVDQAFVRRLRFIVNFPFPDRAVRSEIWQRIFPAQTPIEGLDFELLGDLDVAGGSIRSIALNAAFIAADADEPVRMKYILQAAKLEYQKMGRSLTKAETKYWDLD